jgi:hypothetical protein
MRTRRGRIRLLEGDDINTGVADRRHHQAETDGTLPERLALWLADVSAQKVLQSRRADHDVDGSAEPAA